MKRLITFTAMAFLMTAVLAIADPGRGGRGCGMGDGPNGSWHGDMGDDDSYRPGMLLRLADEIGLDENQKAQILKLNEEHALIRIDKDAELEKAQLKLRHLIMNDGAEKDVLAAMDKVGTMKTEMRKMQYQHRNKVTSLLNADQLKKLKEIGPKMRQGDGAGRFQDCPGGMGQGNGPGNGPGKGPGRGMNCEMPCRR
jgi:hypothetical protein